MRTKVTLVLLFLNVALFFFIFRFERRWRTEDSWKESRKRVLGAEAADIRTLTITGANRDLALTKRGETWFITKPLEWPANPNAVTRIVNDLQFLEHENSFYVRDLAKNGQSLADYGLDHPKLTVAFASGDNSGVPASLPTVLRLGDTTKDGIRLYLLSADGERIHVVSQSLARSLSLTFDELRANTVFTIPVFEAKSLNLQTAASANLRIRLRRDGDKWWFDAPFIAHASKVATELAINSLNELRVKSFITQNPPSSLPSDKPSLRVSLEGNNRRETLVLGDPVPKVPGAAASPDVEYYAQLDGRAALFTVSLPATLKLTMDGAQEKLRETRIIDFDPRAVTTITLTAPGQPPLTLQRLEIGDPSSDAAWQIVLRGDGLRGPQTMPADRVAVARLLEKLSLLEAKTFQSDAPRDADLEAWGFNRPEREITLVTPGAQPVTLQVGLANSRNEVAYARLSGSSASVYAIDPEILRETPVAGRAWRDRLLRELPAGARITALKLTDLEGGKVLVDTPIDVTGRPTNTNTATPAPAIKTVLDHLRSLRAQEFILDQFVDKVSIAGDERPWRYRLDATVTLIGGAGEQASETTLLLTPRAGGDRQWAGSPANEFNTVFAIPQSFVDALWILTEGPRDPGASAPATTTPPSTQ